MKRFLLGTLGIFVGLHLALSESTVLYDDADEYDKIQRNTTPINLIIIPYTSVPEYRITHTHDGDIVKEIPIPILDIALEEDLQRYIVKKK